MIPDSFYKYMSIDTARIVLESMKLRWSCPSKFNDLSELERMPEFIEPLTECKNEYMKRIIDILFSGGLVNNLFSPNTTLLLALGEGAKAKGLTKEELIILLNDTKFGDIDFERGLREYTKKFNDGSLRILCLSEEPENEVMWAHYAQEHTGCMFQFNPLIGSDSPFTEAVKVNYSDCLKVLGSPVDFLLYGETSELKKKTTDFIFYTKSLKWSYEKEWRLMTTRRGDLDRHNDFYFYKEELASVTFGVKTDKNLQDNLSKYISGHYPDCKLYKAYVKRGKLVRKALSSNLC
ncbi:DUF2971 domain-containing protein [Aliivibrio fischeri]|uniref:DUF2971 domain-containing protein n=1 Tax=Aliivibrio fischeri TaxID=668 RepID=UPI0012D924F2|nr:DUF2971 domain-containing protein [Aliivibrio fischeri]MUH95240.1 DUF2971 domain-containing protein [Aliivibrio fischeri]MUI65468.1 DUF2971 domain-containing protein [Aliivibrio fischeri]